MNHGYRHVADYDRCGWGTPWGCKQEIEVGSDVSLVLNAVERPADILDNCHRLFHTACMPSEARPIGARKLAPVVDVTERSHRVRRTRART